MEEKSKEESEGEKINEDLIKERKQKIKSILKDKKAIIFYILLAFIVFLGANIRVQNLYGLKDITTGEWTLGPDLDPFLFLRWAKYIVENGSLMSLDMMRNVPLGFKTGYEMKLLSYMIAWFYKTAKIFSPNITVTYAAVIFPVVFFILTTIAFFLFVKKLFEEKKHHYPIALAATALFIVLPSLLSRTIAGIPEKESAGFLFLFLSFYFFLGSWKAKKTKENIILGVLAGISTMLMAMIWGGFVFIFLAISLATFVAFLFNKIEKKQFTTYFIWFVSSVLLMILFSPRYKLIGLITSTSTGLSFAVFFLLIIDRIIYWKFSNIKIIKNLKNKFPKRIVSLILAVCSILILILIIFGPKFIIWETKDVIDHLIHPFTPDRFTLTVAENRQPYFDEWTGSFGPVIRKIPLFFWLFFIGSIVLFHEAIKKLRKNEKWILTSAYGIFLLCLVFSRYSSNSIMNGISSQSKAVYFGGMILLGAASIYTYYKYFKENRLDLFKEINFSYILLIALFFLTIVAARGGVRLIMILAPVAAVIVGYFSVESLTKIKNKKEEISKIMAIVIALIVIFSTIYTFNNYYKTSRGSAKGFVPSQYTWQWQKAMSWVRQNTSENAVFAHWWDYGYWVQSMGDRATVLDGGNAIVYWNHLMGRHVLTGSNKKSSLDFLYTHNSTHLLIDSTDIGKYPAYASIGSDENYDRYSWIPTFIENKQAMVEVKNGTRHFYQGGFPLDEDFLWKQDGQEIFFPAGSAGIGAVVIAISDNNSLMQPEAIFVYQNKQISVPMRYVYYKNRLYDFKTGYNGGVQIIPKINQQGTGVQIDNLGAMIFLSKRVINSFLVRLYLFDENAGGSFKLVHNEPSIIIQNLRDQGVDIGDFAFFGSVLGPIKIWEIEYPKDVGYNQEYLITAYPKKELEIARGF